MKNSNFLGWLSALTLLILSSCQTANKESLDEQLSESLESASPNGDLRYFRLPESSDFNSIPQDPKNPLNVYKVALGRLLFHETANGIKPKYGLGKKTYSCASCHHAEAGFQAGVAQGIGEGGIGFGFKGEGRKVNPAYPVDSVDVQPIRSPTSMNVAFQTNQLWNGQFGATHLNVGTESKWTPNTPKEKNFLGFHGVETQAIAGQGVHRLDVDHQYLSSIPTYKLLFDKAFPELPENERITLVTCGLALAAYERTVLSNRAPFQLWLRGQNEAMTKQQKLGAVLFFGKAGCVDCHTGPALNSMAFYGYGMNDLTNGHYGAILAGPEKAEHKGRGGFTGKSEDMYKFKVPQLYNLKDAGFYGHGSSFTSVRQVVEYKNKGVPENPVVPASQLAPQFKPLGLTAAEIDALTDFIQNALYDPNLARYKPAQLPSGQCFPNADPQSIIDQGCQ